MDGPQDARLPEGASWPAADGPAQLSHPGVGLLASAVVGGHSVLVLVLSKIKKSAVSELDSKSLLSSAFVM